MNTADASWAAVDWGTSNLRAWVVGTDGATIAKLLSDKGMGALTREEFELELLALLGPYLKESDHLTVIACGMVGARQGWVEAPYLAAPCRPPGIHEAVRASVGDPRIDIRILPGVGQANPPDVMRGEETQIAGYLRENPDYEGVLCLPGTHTKWVTIRAGEIVGFRTFMTGELFALLSKQSVLRHSMTDSGWNDAAFAEAVDDAMVAPQSFAAQLFSLRAGSLLNGADKATCRARLSGLLLGLEIRGARDQWLERDIVLVGALSLTALYRDALAAKGVRTRECDGDAMALAGLKAAYEEMRT